MYKHILVAVDGSENSLRATRQAAGIAALCGDVKVDILSVITIDVYSDMVYDPIEVHGDAQRELLVPAITAMKDVGIDPDIVLMHGRPADEIIRYADKKHVDLVIIGSRGLNALQEFTLGSVSHKVIKHVACPVLIVK
jgi:nucleotide-binding universal stress UspA family protein